MSATLISDFRDTREETTVGSSIARRKGVFGVTFALVLGGGLVSTYLAAPLYEATSAVVFPLKTNAVLSPAQVAMGGALGALGAATPLRQSQFLLESPAATAKVATSLGKSRIETEKKRKIENNPAANALLVRATDTDPKQAQKICRLYVAALHDLSAKTGDAGTDGDLKALDRRIADTDAGLKWAQKDLARFQKGLVSSPNILTSGDGVLVVPGAWLEEKRRAELDLSSLDARLAARKANTATATKMAAKDPTNIPSVRPLRDKLVQLDLDYRTAKSVGGPQSPDVLRLKGEIDETKVTLQRELDGYVRAYKANVADGEILGLLTERVAADARLRSVSRLAASAPAEAARYQSLLARVASATATLEKLKTQRTAAELQDETDPNRWSVLDDATVAEKPVNKSYLMTTVLYAPLALALAGGLACLTDRRRKR